ncbi:hypothetical protein ABT160_36990 [Streptomyces sp. NPDC001941]|uniref:hypothetical protein n=1 Tax=Streptomyces sp. NPDC001941 TaxID=3154659 RepID=UPI0033195A86
MTRATRRFGALSAALAAVIGTATLSVAPASATTTGPAQALRTPTAGAAASCYGGAWSYRKGKGWGVIPTSGNDYYRTTSRCTDINVKPDQDETLELCYENSAHAITCKNPVRLKAGQWKVLGTDFKDGTAFWFNFDLGVVDKVRTGSIAA